MSRRAAAGRIVAGASRGARPAAGALPRAHRPLPPRGPDPGAGGPSAGLADRDRPEPPGPRSRPAAARLAPTAGSPCPPRHSRRARRSMAPADAAVSRAWVESTARAAVQIAAGQIDRRERPGGRPTAVADRIEELPDEPFVIAGGVMVMIGVLAAGSISLGWWPRVAVTRAAGSTIARALRPYGGTGGGRSRDRREKAPSIAGRWDQSSTSTAPSAANGRATSSRTMLVPITAGQHQLCRCSPGTRGR